ncbi:hypothetical protein ACWEOH_02820 [Agromyces sp. NPDC004153]
MAVDTRDRVRRRRTTVVAVFAAIAIAAAVVILAVGGRAGASGDLRSDRDPPDAPPGAAAEQGPVGIIDAWAALHQGWVLVYADGRVLRYSDSGTTLYGERTRDLLLERRLSADGLARLGTGELSAADFGVVLPALMPDDVWADPAFRPYVPSAFAVCAWEGGDGPRGWMNVAGVLDDLPGAAQSILRGTEREFAGYAFDAFQVPYELLGPVTCFGVSPEAAAVVVGMSEHPSDRYRAEGDLLDFTSRHGESISLVILPVMPHGQFVIWGG